MTSIAIISVLLAGAAVLLGLRAAALPRLKAASRLKEIAAYGFAGDGAAVPVTDAADDRRPLERLANSIGTVLVGRLREENAEKIRRDLRAAGYYTAPLETFLGYRAMFSGTFAAFLIWVLASANFSPVFGIGLALYGGALAWMGPMIVLRGRGRRRLERIDIRLPDLIELLVVTVEAGLGFSASIRMATRRVSGDLGDELKLAVQEQDLGVDLRDSLRNMLHRADTPSMRSFVRALDQGQAMGVSVGTIMRNLATEMRKRRRQQVEERAQKAPVKMLFPLIFTIFPALLLILGYPAVRVLLQSFGGG
jgi:tight adherence protein C